MIALRPHAYAAGLTLLTLLAVSPRPAAAAPFDSDPRSSKVVANDNTRPAGRLVGSTLTLALRAARGEWKPEGPAGPALKVEAFGELGSPLAVPAPLVRVTAGTPIVASVRNDLEAGLTVHGLCTRGAAPCPPLAIPPGETREVRFVAGAAGTYHYWASTMGAPVPFRELAGALVVDPPGQAAAPDRILVITEWMNLTPEKLRQLVTADDPARAFVDMKPRFTFVVNGLSWPATERMTYRLGEEVTWRVVNLSSQAHPMHLHGFYFRVDSLGDGLQDRPIDASRRRRVVTQLMPPGGTMAMTWTPEREGNWLFHCHIMHHVSPERRLAEEDDARQHVGHHADDNGSAGMAGMIIGVTVLGPASPPANDHDAPPASRRKLTLVMRREPGQGADAPVAGFLLHEGSALSPSGRVASPGPPLVLQRGEPVEITLKNELGEPTAVHWHGMELESYYDGVHGWSGFNRRLARMIEPGATFVVRFTPPRAGTFIYHTHLHDYHQLSSGLYGPLIVTEPGETFNEATDHVFVLGRSGLASPDASVLTEPESVVLNGKRAPRFVWKAGERHRVRLINITPDDIFLVALHTVEGPATWRPVTKDGAPLPAADAVAGPARQTIAVGETYEFEFDAPTGRKSAWLEVRSPAGKWQVQGYVLIR